MYSGQAKVCNNMQKYAISIQKCPKKHKSIQKYANVSILYKIEKACKTLPKSNKKLNSIIILFC